MRYLNVGSGEHPCPGWVNVDLPWSGVKPGGLMVYADAFRLPFGDATFERVYMGHLWEHVWWHEIAGGAFDEIWRVMQPGAEVVVVGPCMRKAVEQQVPDTLLIAILGEGGGRAETIEGPGAHRWVATEALTAHAMSLAGLVDIETIDVRRLAMPLWPNPAPNALWQAALRARIR